MKHISIFIIFFALLGLKTSVAIETKKAIGTSPAHAMNGDRLNCPFYEDHSRENEKKPEEDKKRFIANSNETLDNA